MSVQMILLPLFVEVILTLVLWSWMAMLRTARFQFGRGAAGQYRVARAELAETARRSLQNAFANQFELPVLFYVLTILEYVTHLAGIVFVVLAWDTL